MVFRIRRGPFDVLHGEISSEKGRTMGFAYHSIQVYRLQCLMCTLCFPRPSSRIFGHILRYSYHLHTNVRFTDGKLHTDLQIVAFGVGLA